MRLALTATLEAKGVLAQSLSVTMDAAAQRRIEAQATFDAMASIVSSVPNALNAVALKTPGCYSHS